jgi:hypothetical protein
MRRKYTEEHISYLREICKGRYNDEITDMFNTKFGLNVTVIAISSLKRRNKISSNLYCKCKPGKTALTTKEQDDYMRSISAGKTNEKLIEIMYERFGIRFTESQMKNYRNSRRIRNGLDYRFKKGNVPPNKGKKIAPEVYEKCAATMFKKGHKPAASRPVGSERLDKDGYMMIKVAEPNKWKPKHVWIWEQANGPVPKGYKILFADQNKSNFALDNLILISYGESAQLNKNRLTFNNAELTKTGLNLVRLKMEMSRRKKKNNENDN